VTPNAAAFTVGAGLFAVAAALTCLVELRRR
jgi:hypothetical protein